MQIPGPDLPLQQDGCGGADLPQPFIAQPQFEISAFESDSSRCNSTLKHLSN